MKIRKGLFVLLAGIIQSGVSYSNIFQEFVENLPQDIRDEYFFEPTEDFKIPMKDGNSYGPGKHINEGEVGLARYNDKFVFIGPGYKYFANPTKKWVTEKPRPNNKYHTPKIIVPLTQPLIEHGTWSIVRVKEGEIGYMLNTMEGKPMFLLPGSHIFNNPHRKFVKFLDFSQSEVKAGNFLFRKIHSGSRGILDLNNGELKILEPGLHIVEVPNKIKSVISIRQEEIPLPRKLYYTKDDVGLQIQASLFYNIKNPLLAFQKAFDSQQDVFDTLQAHALAALTDVVRRQDFSRSKDIKGGDQINYERFLNKTIDLFVETFQKSFGDPNGVVIESISITDIAFDNKDLQNSITKNSILYATSKAEMENVEAKKRLALAQSEKERQVAMIKANTRLGVAKTNAEASEVAYRVKAKEIQILAEAEACAIKAKADAEAYGILAEARAKCELAKMLGSTEFGKQMILAEIQSKALENTKFVLAERIPEFMHTGLFRGGVNPGKERSKSDDDEQI